MATRKEKIGLLKKVSAGRLLTNEDYHLFQPFDWSIAPVWLSNDNGTVENLDTGETMTEEEFEKYKEGKDFITFS